ncbi:MAG: FG-GAP-like repeat-containing protein [Desulfobulbaceae bacterium]|nr:FG-GAP-like repeat-containing protein [Desulfobulbaceae bacterium]
MMKFAAPITPRFLAILLLCLLAVPVFANAAASPPGRVALLPFEAHSDRDLSYLTSGLRDMLASRLASRAGVEIVSRAAITEALAGKPAPSDPKALHALGTSLQADYVLSGSLTALASSLSLDSTLHTINGSEAPRTYYATAPREEEIIGAIDDLSWQIAEKPFGKQRAAAASSSGVAPIPAAGAPGGDAYLTAHPDRVLMGAAAGSSVLRPMGVVTGALGFTKSQTFNYGLVAMETGDVDGDEQNEFVLASAYAVRIYRRYDSRYQKIGEITFPKRYAIHSVTMADLNNNGRQEIYISAADAKEPRSTVLEWDGKEFVHTADNLSWYLRVIDIPGQGPVLAGQKADLVRLFAKGVFRVDLSQGQVTKGEEIACGGMNLFDFSLVDLDGNGGLEVVAISQGDRLMVLTPNGKQLWVSDDYYGGTTRFVGGESFDEINQDLEHGHNERPRLYIPARIVVRDMNNDGLPDIVVNKNLSSSSRILSRYRSYPNGEIHALTWNGISLTELWRTRKIDGYIADYQLGKVETVAATEGKPLSINAELNVGVVLNSGGLDIFNASSAVLSFPLHLTGEEGK